jgi:sulfate/thiosulfate transport system substrate-binding protein
MKISLRPRRIAAVTAAITAAVLGIAACSSSGGAGSSDSIRIVAFSVPEPAYTALSAAFQKTPDGKGVTFSTSYGPSGSQASAVTSGQVKADYVGFSLEPDMAKLVPDFVDAGWDKGATKGIVSSSVVVICVRKGNPLHITGWDDLIKPGVKIVNPDPATSGSAKWNILAAYEHSIAEGHSASDAQSYLKSFFANVVSKPDSGSDAMSTFSQGTGDVLVSYENEAIHARQSGIDLDYIVPDQTMLIQNPGAVTKDAPAVATKFLDYAESAAGQKVFAENGFRPVDDIVPPGKVPGANDPAKPFPAPQHLITVASIGGWDKVNDEFFGDNGIVTKIEGTG